MVSWFPLIMPEMYDRLTPTEASSKWDFSSYQPDVVVVNLFQNDFPVFISTNLSYLKCIFVFVILQLCVSSGSVLAPSALFSLLMRRNSRTALRVTLAINDVMLLEAFCLIH